MLESPGLEPELVDEFTDDEDVDTDEPEEEDDFSGSPDMFKCQADELLDASS